MAGVEGKNVCFFACIGCSGLRKYGRTWCREMRQILTACAGSPMLSREASPLLGRFGSGSFAAEVAKGSQALPAAKGRAGSPVLERFGSGRLAAQAAMVTAEDALGPVSRSPSLDLDSPAGSWRSRSGTPEVS